MITRNQESGIRNQGTFKGTCHYDWGGSDKIRTLGQLYFANLKGQCPILPLPLPLQLGFLRMRARDKLLWTQTQPLTVNGVHLSSAMEVRELTAQNLGVHCQ